MPEAKSGTGGGKSETENTKYDVTVLNASYTLLSKTQQVGLAGLTLSM
jgi:hypothetical protein